jgi:hypothetical protein
MNANSLEKSWGALCPPAQLFPIFMVGLILFNLYRGTYRYAMTHTVSMLVGTVFLWILCAAKFEVAAWALLVLPVLFFVFFLAVLFYDQSILSVSHSYEPCGCCDVPETCNCACGH